MKAIYCLLFSLLFCCKPQAQNITNAEYFFDTDPGVGKANPFAVTPGNTISISNASIPTTDLAAGFHNLAMRMQDAAGVWTQTEIRPLFITEFSVVSSSLQTVEYFFDTDPGVGMATNIAIPTGSSINASLVIPVLNLPAGFHNLVVRVKNNFSVWSQREIRPFFIMTDDFITRNIVAAEYFIDSDPGLGNAAPITVPAPTSNFNSGLQLPLPSNISEGVHFLFARVKDNLNRWSLFSLDTFTVNLPLPVTGLHLKVAKSGLNHLLLWKTQTEINSRSFEIEHSTNGINFLWLGTVAAAGNSNNLLQYHFTSTPSAANTHFYRLAQTDMDGRMQYSNTVAIQNSANENGVAVYPNPTKGLIAFHFAGKEKKVLAQVIDMQGRTLLRNLLVNQPILQLNTTGFAAGMYLVHLTDGITTEIGRFVKE